MNKTNLEQYGDKSQDLLFWIKSYLASKIYKLKPNKGIEEFDREMGYSLIDSSSSIDELKDNTNTIATKISGLRNYSTPLISFYKYATSDKKLLSLKKIDTNYINTYTKLNNISSNYYVQLRSLFKFIDINIIDDFKFDIGFKKDGTKAKLPVAMNKEKTFNYLEPKEFEKFILSISKYKTNHPNPYLLKLMVKFLCFGGFRADEVQHIKHSDISFKDMNNKQYMQIYVMGKGDKERFVYILYELIKDEYENYLRVKEEKQHKSEYLFYTREIQKFSDKRIYDIVKDFYNKSGLHIENFSCHTLRRSYATTLHALGVPLDTISILLGHSTDETVEFYVFASKQKGKEVPNIFKFI